MGPGFSFSRFPPGFDLRWAGGFLLRKITRARWAGDLKFEDVPSETLVFEIAIDKSQGAGHVLARGTDYVCSYRLALIQGHASCVFFRMFL